MCPPGSWTCPPEEFPPGDMSIPCAGMGVAVFLHSIGRRLLSADEFRRGLPQHGAWTGFGGLSLGFELPRERGRQTHRQRGCHNRGYQFWVLPTSLSPRRLPQQQVRVIPAAQTQSLCNPRHRHHRLRPQPPRHLHLARVALRALLQIGGSTSIPRMPKSGAAARKWRSLEYASSGIPRSR
jgi:hypothetical protein